MLLPLELYSLWSNMIFSFHPCILHVVCPKLFLRRFDCVCVCVTHAHMHVQICICTYIHFTHTHTCTHARTHARTRARARTPPHTHVQRMYVNTFLFLFDLKLGFSWCVLIFFTVYQLFSHLTMPSLV